VAVKLAEAPTLTVKLAGETVGAEGEPTTIIAPETFDVVLGQDAELTTQ
jgi:hypothetical protein